MVFPGPFKPPLATPSVNQATSHFPASRLCFLFLLLLRVCDSVCGVVVHLRVMVGRIPLEFRIIYIVAGSLSR